MSELAPIVCLIATWRDGPLLAEAVASAAPHVDQVIVLDGAYSGIVEPGEMTCSDIKELHGATVAGANVITSFSLDGWRGEIEKRNVLLELGRAAVGERYIALVLDADEVLVHGAQLRQTPGPLIRFEPNGSAWWAPSRSFYVDEAIRYHERSYWLQQVDTGERIDLSHGQCLEPHAVEMAKAFATHVQHRWDLRDEWRAGVQHEWGRELARRDGIA